MTSPPGITARRFGASLGARVEGIDLSQALDDGTFEHIRELFLEHLVLVFPNQRLGPEQQVAFAERWGRPTVHPIVPHIEGHPAIVEIRNTGKARTLNEHWHSDVTFNERPPLATMLYALEVPKVGGDTQFANQYLAYEALSDGMRRLLDGVQAVHSGAGLAAVTGADRQAAPHAIHPVVRTHPETGRKALYVCRAFTQRFVDTSQAESRPLLDYLMTHAVRPDFTVRHAWSVGDVVLWDNRCVQHYAIHDHGDAPRLLHRTTIDGDRP